MTIDTLSPEIQQLWLGRLQTEIGVQASNVLLYQTIIDDLNKRIETDSALIETLRNRVKEAEAVNVELKAFIKEKNLDKKAGNQHHGKNAD